MNCVDLLKHSTSCSCIHFAWIRSPSSMKNAVFLFFCLCWRKACFMHAHSSANFLSLVKTPTMNETVAPSISERLQFRQNQCILAYIHDVYDSYCHCCKRFTFDRRNKYTNCSHTFVSASSIAKIVQCSKLQFIVHKV